MALRNDGIVSYYEIEHRQSGLRIWVGSNVGYFLFKEMLYQDRCGELGDRYRTLLEPASASNALFQQYGITGAFEFIEDAEAVLAVLRITNPKQLFRLVRRTVEQQTEVLRV